VAPQFFGNAGREHMEKYGRHRSRRVPPRAKIGHKNHEHSVNDPYSQFQDEYALEQIKAAPMVWEPLTELQCCPTSDGAGAAVLASEEFVKKRTVSEVSPHSRRPGADRGSRAAATARRPVLRAQAIRSRRQTSPEDRDRVGADR